MASHGEKIWDHHTTVDAQEPVSHTNTIEEAKRSSGMAESFPHRRSMLTRVKMRPVLQVTKSSTRPVLVLELMILPCHA